MAKHTRTGTGSRQFSETVTLHARAVGHLWPQWVSFLLIAVIVLILVAASVWIVRGVIGRLRGA